MSELRVPTVALAAEVLCADGRSFLGRIFVPASASRHAGPTRAVEWMNDPSDFFPFLPDDGGAPVLLNKHEVLVISVPAAADEGDLPGEMVVPEKRVVVECGERRLAGVVVIDMPANQRRVLDCLNRPEGFLILRDADRHHLVRKERITRVIESTGE